ncbi:hypothetical protein LINPERHAP1_LOCUS809 [Linum perenne]
MMTEEWWRVQLKKLRGGWM